MDKLVAALLKPINTTAIIVLGLYTVLWGLWLAAPWWDVFSRAPLYSHLAHTLPETIWGLIAISCGLVTVYGALHPSYKALSIGSTVAFFHWFIISIFYFWGDWQNTGGITALTFSTYALFIHLNVKVNYKNGKMTIQDILV